MILGHAFDRNHMEGGVVFPRMRTWCGITCPFSLASQKYTPSLGWDPGRFERAFVDGRTIISGEGGSFWCDRIWKLLAVDGELAPAPPTLECMRRGAGYPVGPSGLAVGEHLAQAWATASSCLAIRCAKAVETRTRGYSLSGVNSLTRLWSVR